MKQHTKKPITMNRIITTYTHLAYIFTACTVFILLYEGFHIRRGSIFKIISFIVVTILFYHYAQKVRLEEDKSLESTRENFYTRRTQERRISLSILILICIFIISSIMSISSRRPSWEYRRDKKLWEKRDADLQSLPDTIPDGAKGITYYCIEFPKLLINFPIFYIRYTLNDKNYKQVKKKIIKQGALKDAKGQQSAFSIEPEDMRQHSGDYQTYIYMYGEGGYNSLGVKLNDKKREICYFYASYHYDDYHNIIE